MRNDEVMYEFTVYAPAKLNLYLDVLDKRPDGYHNIKTIFEKIDLRDEIIIREKAGGLDVRVEPSVCPSGKDNIVYRAVQALFKEVNVNLGLEIIIKKRIPAASGLGGGSSDAASALRSINEQFGRGVGQARLFSLAAAIGKDIPFFMLEPCFAIGRGAGELLKPIDIDGYFSHIIIKPDITISTAEMYKRLDQSGYKSREFDNIEKVVSALKKKDLTLLRETYYNIFEEVLLDYSHFVDEAKSFLSEAGAGPTFMSGSGPSVFCTVKEREEAIEILKRIPKAEGMRIYLATSYKGGIYGDNRGQDIS